MAYTPLLTRRTSLFAQVESVYDAGPPTSYSAATDSLLIMNETFAGDMTVQERKLLHSSLSRLPHLVGKKVGKYKFTTTLAGNGRSQSGVLADAPMISRLLRGCGMAQTAFTAPWVSPVTTLGSPAGAVIGVPVSWVSAEGSLPFPPNPTQYVVTVTKAGGSGVAQVSIVSNDLTGAPQFNVVLTSGAQLNLSNFLTYITPTFSGSLAVGQAWVCTQYPAGIAYTPISTGFESIAMRLAMDGSIHDVTGAMGTFVIKATAGQMGQIDFDFTGRYVPYADAVLPTTATGLELPAPIFEQAAISVNGYMPLITAVSLDIGNTVTQRDSANSIDGFFGVYITDRMAKGGIDPQATLAASQNFWAHLASGTLNPICGHFGGSTPGNRFWFSAPASQYTGLTYKNSSGIRHLDAALVFNQANGDDEILIYAY